MTTEDGRPSGFRMHKNSTAGRENVGFGEGQKINL